MDGRSAVPENAGTDRSDSQDLHRETLDLLVGVIVAISLGFLGLAAVDQNTNQLSLWAVFLPLVAAAAAGRSHRLSLTIASILVIALLALSALTAAIVYPDSQLNYALPLVIIASGLLLDSTAAFVTAALLSIATIALIRANAVQVASPGLNLFLIWITAILSWLASRPGLIALNWAWRNYEIALQRTEELRGHRAELARLARSLGETCDRLEAMNWELERARRTADEARHLKTEFAATISHELRTPLNLIIGFSDMMVRNPRAYGGERLPEAYQEDLATIHRNAYHMSQLVDDVLDLSQIDAHRMALEKTHVSLNAIVNDACAMVRALYERSGLTLTIDAPPDLPLLNVDANRIRQILVNLLNNAVRFTDQGGVTLRAACNGQDVVISVSDTGDGIAPEDLPNIFQEFQQVGTRDRRRGGSGFGLAVCKRFAEMHGGCMWAESQFGQGSTFYLALPLSENVVSTAFSSRFAPRPILHRTVAVLDQASEMTRILRRYLDGYDIIHVPSVRTLSRLVVRRPMHAIIQVNSASAVELQSAQATNRRLRDIPVLSCSLSTPSLLVQQLGVAECLVKPIDQDQLAKALQRVPRETRDIMIVDDEPEMIRLLAGLMRRGSDRTQIQKACDGRDALRLARAKRPDLVLLDLQMPGMSGYDLIREMKLDANLRNVPVIVITGRRIRDEAVRIGEIGFQRPGGLTVGELIGCLNSNLDGLYGPTAAADSQAARHGLVRS